MNLKTSNDFGAVVRAYRDERGMSQRELALAMDTSNTSISCWESGARLPSIGLMRKLCAYTGWSEGDTLGCIERTRARLGHRESGGNNGLTQLRRDAGFSQSELADLVGVERSTISKWELRGNAPRISAAVKLAEIFGVTVADIERACHASEGDQPDAPLSPFTFEGHPVRADLDDDGEPMLVAKDVFEALGISWTGAQSLGSIRDDWKVVRKLLTTFGERDTWFLKMSAVYKLAFRSGKPEAERFTDWVAGEVLPSLSRTGSYSMPTATPTAVDTPPSTLTPDALAAAVAGAMTAALPAIIQAMQVQNAEMMRAAIGGVRSEVDAATTAADLARKHATEATQGVIDLRAETDGEVERLRREQAQATILQGQTVAKARLEFGERIDSVERRIDERLADEIRKGERWPSEVAHLFDWYTESQNVHAQAVGAAGRSAGYPERGLMVERTFALDDGKAIRRQAFTAEGVRRLKSDFDARMAEPGVYTLKFGSRNFTIHKGAQFARST